VKGSQTHGRDGTRKEPQAENNAQEELLQSGQWKPPNHREGHKEDEDIGDEMQDAIGQPKAIACITRFRGFQLHGVPLVREWMAYAEEGGNGGHEPEEKYDEEQIADALEEG
jgi:hypothetical protein